VICYSPTVIPQDAMAGFDYDPDEIVRWPGIGEMTLYNAVRKIIGLPETRRADVILYREPGSEPKSFKPVHIDAG
jgi:hypothetical protein